MDKRPVNIRDRLTPHLVEASPNDARCASKAYVLKMPKVSENRSGPRAWLPMDDIAPAMHLRATATLQWFFALLHRKIA